MLTNTTKQDLCIIIPKSTILIATKLLELQMCSSVQASGINTCSSVRAPRRATVMRVDVVALGLFTQRRGAEMGQSFSFSPTLWKFRVMLLMASRGLCVTLPMIQCGCFIDGDHFLSGSLHLCCHYASFKCSHVEMASFSWANSFIRCLSKFINERDKNETR